MQSNLCQTVSVAVTVQICVTPGALRNVFSAFHFGQNIFSRFNIETDKPTVLFSMYYLLQRLQLSETTKNSIIIFVY